MEPKFMLDAMLGGLARWLRICGYDATYKKNAPDDELLKIISGNGRVLLTRDRLLHRKAIKAGLNSFYVEGENDADKIANVSRRFQLKLNPNNSRCPKCGEKLHIAKKESIRHRVPSHSFEVYDMFWKCGLCKQVYWRGSHWENIVKKISEASKKAGATTSKSKHT